MADDKICPEHGTPMRTEPLTRFDAQQIGSLTLDVCDQCDDEAEAGLAMFLSRIAADDFGSGGTQA